MSAAETMQTKRTKFQKSIPVEIHRSQLKNAPYNPRQIKPAAKSRLKRGIEKHGLVGGIVWNVRTGNIVGGHQRITAMDELEQSKDYNLTVEQVDIPEEQEIQLNLLLNNKSAQGENVADLMQDLLAHMIGNDIDIEGAGYTTTDVQNMFPDTDMFATGEMAEQLEAEANVVAELEDISRTSKDFEAGFRERMGLEPTKAMRDAEARQQEVGDDSDGDEEPAPWEQGGSGFEDGPVESGSPQPDAAAPGDTPAWMQSKEDFKRDRQRTVNHNADVAAEADVLLTLAFQTKAQMLEFMRAFSLNPDNRQFGLFDIEASFGVQLPR